jgi:hypothetical protein
MICRVHWLLHNLEREFKANYKLSFNYANHSYMFYRMNGKKIKDVFIVVRTSKRCWRVSYANTETTEYQSFTCKKSVNVARRMWYIYKIDERRKKE